MRIMLSETGEGKFFHRFDRNFFMEKSRTVLYHKFSAFRVSCVTVVAESSSSRTF